MSAGNKSEETEEIINQHLEELGLLEDGMSSDDKRSLWKVIKISEDTAQAEEQDRQKRARTSLQFDEVSSRSEVPKDGENEKKPIMAAVSPRLRSNSQDNQQPNTATVHPFCHSSTSSSVSSSSRTFTAPSSPSQQSSCPGKGNLKPIEPSPRRCLRSRTTAGQSHLDEVQEISQTQNSQSSSSRSPLSPRNIENPLSTENFQSSLSPQSLQTVASPRSTNNVSSLRNTNNVPSSRSTSNVSSPRSTNNAPSPQRIQNVPSPRSMSASSPKSEQVYHTKHENEPQESSSKRWSQVTRDDSEPNLPSSSAEIMDLPDEGSPKCSDHESSPVRRLSQGFTLSLNFQKTDEDGEECSALNEKERSDTVPSPASETSERPSPDVDKNRMQDRERNIDAFSCDRSNYGLTLKVRKPKRMCSRLPFYIPSHKMDVQAYTAYFKKCISDHTAKLLEIQRQSHKCVPWGDPVVVGEVNSNPVISLEQKNTTSSHRYNFRGRKVAHQKVDTIFEDSEGQNDCKTQDDDEIFDSLLDEEKPTENTQTAKKEELQGNVKPNATVPDRQGSKRKSDSSDEMEEKRPASGVWLSTDKPEEEETAVKRKKLGTVRNGGAAKNWKDLNINIPEVRHDDEEYEPSKKITRRQGQGKKRNQRKLYKKQTTITAGDDETDLFAEMTDVKKASSPPRSCQEVDIPKPGPIKLRKQGRNRVLQNTQKNEVEVSVVFETASSSSKEQDIKVPCPICRVGYPAKDIEAHASECTEYCAEEILEDEERSSSPQVSSEDCWTQFEKHT